MSYMKTIEKVEIYLEICTNMNKYESVINHCEVWFTSSLAVKNRQQRVTETKEEEPAARVLLDTFKKTPDLTVTRDDASFGDVYVHHNNETYRQEPAASRQRALDLRGNAVPLPVTTSGFERVCGSDWLRLKRTRFTLRRQHVEYNHQ